QREGDHRGAGLAPGDGAGASQARDLGAPHEVLTMQLQSGKLSERASVIRYILQASGISPKSLAERNMLRSALDPLATEIAIARGIEKDAAEQLLVETAALGAPTAEDEKVAA